MKISQYFIFYDHCCSLFNSREKYEERSAFDLSQAVELLEHNEFDNMKPTVFYIHGFLESLKSESVECVVNGE